jgi:DNA-binding MarR family transcriptional regulator
LADLLDQPSLDEGEWLNVKELADRHGVTRQAMHKRVREFEKQGHIKTRKKGRNVMVNVAEFTLAVSEHGNGLAEQSAATRNDDAPAGHDPESLKLREAQRKRAESEAQLSQLKLDKELGLVRSVSDIEEASVALASALLRVAEKLPAMSEEIARAAGGTDMKAAKAAARPLVDEFRKQLVEGLGDAVSSHERGKVKTRKKSEAVNETRIPA